MAGDIILVTGGNGFLGQHVIKLLQEKADHVAEIRILDVTPFEKKLDYKANKPMVSIVGSITDEDTLNRATKGVNCVMHLAGIVSVRTLPEKARMEEVNVKGTQMVIQACIEQNVERLIYSSTMNVVIGHEDIVNGSETNLDYAKHYLFESYAETKCEGEQAVLKANRQKSSNGIILRTLALRPVAMYGELDPHVVTPMLNYSSRFGGVLVPLATERSYFDFAYVGNVSWAFVCANKAMQRNSHLDGEIFFITDDTKPDNIFSFSKPYIESVGFKVLNYGPPYWLVYILFMLLEFIARLISPLIRFELPGTFNSIKSFNLKINFVSTKAKSLLSYDPIYDPLESQKRSMKYYDRLYSKYNVSQDRTVDHVKITNGFKSHID